MEARYEPWEHCRASNDEYGGRKGPSEVDWDLRFFVINVGRRRKKIVYEATFSNESRIVSATLLSSTSPPSNSTSAPRSLIHPGIIRVPRPVPVCCATGGTTFKYSSVAVEWRV